MLISECRDTIQLLTLNNPTKRNALHPHLISALSHRLAEIETDAKMTVVVLTGAGSSFCSGLDLFHLASLNGHDRGEYLRTFFAVFSQIYCLKQPVIAAVNGPAIAGGFDLAAACDLRLCSREARFGQTEVLLGITQIMYPIYKSIGLGRAKELALTGKLISADEAYRIGLVNHVYAAEELQLEALKLAELLASRPRDALFATKRLSRELLDTNAEAAFRLMFETISERLKSEEHRTELQKHIAR
ncbi:MAG TPA: enoyl-CoA hydratase/isomerase family protein [Terriglobales bacterium]|nr:enoyl-CoA hydratase/isomerase family protein [Terriglobales bacterium]